MPCKSAGTRKIENTLVPSALGRADKIKEPPPRLDTPKVPVVSEKTNSGTGAPDEALPNLRKSFASAGRFKNASRVIRTKASNRREAACSVSVTLVLSNAAAVME